MAANATTKIQVNWGKDGLLVNVYADNAQELEQLLTTVQDTSALIESVGHSIGRGGSQPTGGNAAYAAKAFNATPVVDTPPFNNAPATTGERKKFETGMEIYGYIIIHKLLNVQEVRWF
jgi:hypothetical protein